MTRNPRSRRRRRYALALENQRGSLASILLTATGLLTAASLFAVAPLQGQAENEDGGEEAYGYFRVIEGEATLTPAGDGEGQGVERHQPVLAGDRLEVDRYGRVEVLLSDWNVLRLDGDTDVAFHRLAFSPDSEDTETRIELYRGNLQLIVPENVLGDEAPSIDTINSTLYLHRDGVYRISTDPGGWTQVVVRSGYAEVVSKQGSTLVRAGEEAVIEGSYRSSTRVARAGRRDSLERWGEDLDSEALEGSPYVDEELRYAAAPLEKHGSWLSVEGRRAWRPYADPGWRPYWRGRWVYTPSGLSWVSSEPWGWVPYHYGSWDLVPRYGWVWFPGRRFSVAHVHWYWGPEYVAWFPSGYYHRFYGPRFGFGFGRGVFGYAGGSWDPFDDWFFCRPRYLGHRRQYSYLRTGRHLRRDHGGRKLPRGFITTDTRDLTPERWRDHERVREVLRAPRRPDGDGGLPDVTAFIAREPELTPEILERFKKPEPGPRRTPRRGGGAKEDGLDSVSTVLGSPPDRRGRAPRVSEPKDEGRALPRVYTGTPARQPGVAAPRSRPEVREPKQGPSDRPRLGTPDRRPAEGPKTEAQRPRLIRPDEGLRGQRRMRRPDARPPEERKPELRQPPARQPRGARAFETKPSVRTAPPQRPERVKPRSAAPRTPTRPRVEVKTPPRRPRATDSRRPTVKRDTPLRTSPGAAPPAQRRPTTRRAEPKRAERPTSGSVSSRSAAPKSRAAPPPRSRAPQRKASPRTGTGSREQLRSRPSSGSRSRAAAPKRPTQRSSPRVRSSPPSSKRSSSASSGSRSRSPRSGASASRSNSRPSRSSASKSSGSGSRRSSASGSRRSAPQKRSSKPPNKRRDN